MNENEALDFPEIRICRIGEYATLYVNRAAILLKDFKVTESMNGAHELTATFDLPVNITELNLSASSKQQTQQLL